MDLPNQPSLNPNQEEWCLGWKLVGTRRLEAAELNDLQQETNRISRRKWGFCCGCPFVFFAPFFLFASLYDMGRNNPTAAEGAAVVMLVLLIPSAWMLLKGNDANTQNRGRAADLRGGIVKRFAGKRKDFEWQEILENQRADLNLEEDLWIEVLPHSQAIFSIGGTRPNRWLAAPIATVATTPGNANQSAFWHQAGGGDDVTLRSLSVAEKEEISQHHRTMLRRPFFSALIFTLWIGIPFVAHLATGTPIKVELLAYFIVAMAAWSNWNLWRTYLLARRITQDIENGQVALLRPPIKVEEIGGEPPSELRAALWEVLPESGLIWTADGVPASWRKAKI